MTIKNKSKQIVENTNSATTTTNPIYKYIATIRIPPPKFQQLTLAQHAINVAFGFEDGLCNERNGDGELVGKAMDAVQEKLLLEAHHNMNMTIQTKIEVSVFKDGTKSWRFI